MPAFPIWAVRYFDANDTEHLYEIRDLPLSALEALGAPHGMTYADVLIDPASRGSVIAGIVACVAQITGALLPPVLTGRDALAATANLVLVNSEPRADEPKAQEVEDEPATVVMGATPFD
jgi:hypothetical protein